MNGIQSLNFSQNMEKSLFMYGYLSNFIHGLDIVLWINKTYLVVVLTTFIYSYLLLVYFFFGKFHDIGINYTTVRLKMIATLCRGYASTPPILDNFSQI